MRAIASSKSWARGLAARCTSEHLRLEWHRTESTQKDTTMDNLAMGLASKKESRAALMHRLELLESGQMHTGAVVFGNMVEGDIKRAKSLIAEYDLCIADFERALDASSPEPSRVANQTAAQRTVMPHGGHPFRPGEWYELGQLRYVAEEIFRARRADPILSAMMRAQNQKELPWAKSWNEELRPLKVLADHKGLSDDEEFCWTPDHAADFNIRTTSGAMIKIQRTMAFAERNFTVAKHGGHLHKLEKLQCNKDGYCFPGGLVTEPSVLCPNEDAEAWRRGITKALKNKLRSEYAGCHLLIFAPECGRDLRELVESFAQVVTSAIEQIVGKAEWERVFEGLYICDDFYFVDVGRSKAN
jgi:hypothetical protein